MSDDPLPCTSGPAGLADNALSELPLRINDTGCWCDVRRPHRSRQMAGHIPPHRRAERGSVKKKPVRSWLPGRCAHPVTSCWHALPNPVMSVTHVFWRD